MPISTAARATLGAPALALALALAGCGGGAQEPAVASAASAGAAPAAVASADAATEYVEGVRKFVACLRAEGVEVTDPDAKGKFEYSGDTRAQKKDPKFLAAQAKCTKLLPSVPEGLEDAPVLTAEEVEAKRSYAQCMRKNGATDFPDPGSDGQWPESSDGKPVWNQNAPAAKRAEAACGSIIGTPASSSPAQG